MIHLVCKMVQIHLVILEELHCVVFHMVYLEFLDLEELLKINIYVQDSTTASRDTTTELLGLYRNS